MGKQTRDVFRKGLFFWKSWPQGECNTGQAGRGSLSGAASPRRSPELLKRRASSVPVRPGGTCCIRREQRTVPRGKPAARASGKGATPHRTRGRAHQEEKKSRKRGATWALRPFSVSPVLPPAAAWPLPFCFGTRFSPGFPLSSGSWRTLRAPRWRGTVSGGTSSPGPAAGTW